MTALSGHLTRGIAAAPPSALAAQVHFASPFAEYTGRGRVERLFTVMPSVFDELTVVRELHGTEETATVLRGRIGSHDVDVILDERRDDDGLVGAVMLMLRPLAGIEEAVRRMRAAL